MHFFSYLMTEANPENTGLVKPWQSCLLKKINGCTNQSGKILTDILEWKSMVWKPSSYITDFSDGLKCFNTVDFNKQKRIMADLTCRSARPDGSCKSSHSLLHSQLFFMRVMSFSIIKPSPFCTKLLCVLKCNLAGGELGIFSDQGRLKRTNNW